MGVRNRNSTNYVHPDEPNLLNLHKALEYNGEGKPVLRTVTNIEGGIKGDDEAVDGMASIHKADLGYCNFHHFKCAGTRSCSSWITGGAIDNKDRTE